MTTSISIALKNQGIDKLTKLEQMFSCHNREKKRREYAKLKENLETFKNKVFLTDNQKWKYYLQVKLGRIRQVALHKV